MITLSRLYADGAQARAVVDDLKAAGLSEDDLGIIAPSHDRSAPMAYGGVRNLGNRKPAVQGAALAAGLLAGLGAFVLPGIGAVVAAGWLVRTIADGAAGGVVGALIAAGIEENAATGYADGVRRGGTLIAIRVSNEDRDFYQDILFPPERVPHWRNSDAAGILRDGGALRVKRS